MSIDTGHMHTFSTDKNITLIVATLCINTTIKDICKSSKAGILMEDILESDSGLFSKDQTLAALRHARNRQYLCVLFLTPFWSAQPLCVYIEGNKSEKQHGCQSDSPRGGQIIIIIIIILTAPSVLALASMQQTAFSSQKPLYHLVFLCISSPLFKGAVEGYVFSCIISLLPKCLCWRSAGRAQLIYSTEGFFLSLFEAIWTFSL